MLVSWGRGGAVPGCSVSWAEAPGLVPEPAECIERHVAAAVELDAFALEQRALQRATDGIADGDARAAAGPTAEDAMPGNAVARAGLLQCGQGKADVAR